MKFKTLLVLVLAGLWGAGSWWWYTCNIKGFCDADQNTLAQSDNTVQATPATGTDKADLPADSVALLAEDDDEPEEPEEKSAESLEKITEATEVSTETEISDSSENSENVETTNKTETTETETIKSETEVTAEQTTEDKADPVSAEQEAEATDTADIADNDQGTQESQEIQKTTEDSAKTSMAEKPKNQEQLTEPEPESDKHLDDNEGDKIINALDTDTDTDDDGDGISNGAERLLGTNPTLTDSDGDGLSDNFEIVDERDSDGDGTIDALDPDDDDDGIMTAMENADPNGDGNPEDALDSNDNGLPDYLDTDNTPIELPTAKQIAAEKEAKAKAEAEAKAATEPSAGKAEQNKPENESEAEEKTATEDTSGEADQDKPESETKTEEKIVAEDSAEKDAQAKNTEKEEDIKHSTKEKSADKADKKDDANKVTLDTSVSKAAPGSIDKARLYFPFRSSEPELSDSVADYFDLIIQQLKDKPDVKIRVTGHTDNIGTGADNKKLGRKRAEQVRDMLVKRGAPTAQILVHSEGEGKWLVNNKTAKGRKKNRRVEIEQVK